MYSVTKCTENKSGTFTAHIAYNAIVEKGGFKTVQKEWYYMEVAEEVELGQIEDFDLSVFEQRTSQVPNEDGTMMTFVWLY